MNLKEFAERIGLSQTTASRALGGYPEVSEATRARVLKAAEELGYRPNTSARSLATGRAGAIGIVLQGGASFGPHFSEFMNGLSSRLQLEGLDILVSTVDGGAAEEDAYRRFAASKRVDAVIVTSPACTDSRIELLRSLRLPFVVHGRSDAAEAFAYLDIDNEGAIRKATDHLLDLGHRRIAFISGNTRNTYARDREAGYRGALAARGVPVAPSLLGNGAFTDEIGFRLMRGFLEGAEPPTAVITGSMMSGLGAMRAIRVAGLTVGRDVSVIAHDDVFPYLSPENLVPTVSTTRSPIRDAGARIADMAMRLVAGARPETLQEVWPVDLVIRRSTAPPPE